MQSEQMRLCLPAAAVGLLSVLPHLLLGLCDGSLQHEGELLHLLLQTVVVAGERPQGRLQAQQVHTHP